MLALKTIAECINQDRKHNGKLIRSQKTTMLWITVKKGLRQTKHLKGKARLQNYMSCKPILSSQINKIYAHISTGKCLKRHTLKSQRFLFDRLWGDLATFPSVLHGVNWRVGKVLPTHQVAYLTAESE